MLKLNSFHRFLVAAVILIGSSVASAQGKPTDIPLIGTISGTPMLMINMSRDHQLDYRAYLEYQDLDGDGVLETQYKHSIDYYGYFDPYKCYAYTNGVFVPQSVTPNKYCVNQWSGNFLNWGTMTRMDIVRKILYGGKRVTDSGATTILERQFLPTDAHSFSKYYRASDIDKLTPFTAPLAPGQSGANGEREITLCNTTIGTGASTTSTAPPLMRVVGGNYLLWNNNERWQCYWSEEKQTNNIAAGSIPGFNPATNNPSRDTQRLGGTDFIVRVQACVAGLLGREQCEQYPNSGSPVSKPTGLLHDYGKNDDMYFSLMSGSYQNNINGGVLRSNMGSFKNEVNSLTDGSFSTSAKGIVYNLDRFRIFGYDYGDGSYIGFDNCSYQQIGLNNGSCRSWGNPTTEIYIESLRYLAGKTATGSFTGGVSGGADGALGLTVASWQDPFKSNIPGVNSCSPVNVLNFNAGISSWDANSPIDITGIGALSSAAQLTKQIGDIEGITGTMRAIGAVGGVGNKLCTLKQITDLGQASGVCPAAPTQQGSFNIAGAAFWARTNKLRSDLTDTPADTTSFKPLRVNTFGVVMSTSTPQIRIFPPGKPEKAVSIQPTYRLDKGGTNTGNGTLVDFRVVRQDLAAGTGLFYVNWEDSEQGGDYDMDSSGYIEYAFTNNGTQLRVRTLVTGFSSINAQGFGYIISGTDKDGPHFHSGARDFSYTDAQPIDIYQVPSAQDLQTAALGTRVNGVTGSKINTSGGCVNCQPSNDYGNPVAGVLPTTAVYTVIGGSPESLRDPLYYAAKFGGFKDADGDGVPNLLDEWASKNRRKAPFATMTDADAAKVVSPDNFFLAANPGELPAQLRAAFQAAAGQRSRAALAVSSSNIRVGTQLFGTTFDEKWTGDLTSYAFGASLALEENWKASAKLTGASLSDTRTILTSIGGAGVAFRWANLPTGTGSERSLLNRLPGATVGDGLGEQRLLWLRGDESNESSKNKAVSFRDRPVTKLGDIINSQPWYVGKPDAGFTGSAGAGYSQFVSANFNRKPAIYVGANDGMLHAFYAPASRTDLDKGSELLAYVPRRLFEGSKLSALTDVNYSHRFYADGSPMVADVKVGTGSSASDWKSILFSTLGAGGQGIFALDVTDPSQFSESNAASIVRWEISDQQDADIGYMLGQATLNGNLQPHQVMLLPDGNRYLVLGNGVGSEENDIAAGSGKAAVFLIRADRPAGATAFTNNGSNTDVIKIVAESVLGGNGLAMPSGIDSKGDGVIDYIYAGDLKGNLWKFDVSSPTRVWKVAFGGNPLFVARDGANVRQPITSAPAILAFSSNVGGYIVTFGTGKFYQTADMTSTTLQSAYGVWDDGTGILASATRANLVKQEIDVITVGGSGTSAGTLFRRMKPANPVCYKATLSGCTGQPVSRGWFVDLPTPKERVVINTQISSSADILVTTWIPGGTTCEADGVTWYMTLAAADGAGITRALYDVDGNGVIGGLADTGDSSAGSAWTGRQVSGLVSALVSFRKEVNPGDAPSNECPQYSPSAQGGAPVKTTVSCPLPKGRLGWREVVR